MSRAAVLVVMLRVAAALQRPRTVVLTGGPCSGKTTALETLPGRLPCGSKVLRVKEAATLYHERGGALPFRAASPTATSSGRPGSSSSS
jgi:predicted ATPase